MRGVPACTSSSTRIPPSSGVNTPSTTACSPTLRERSPSLTAVPSRWRRACSDTATSGRAPGPDLLEALSSRAASGGFPVFFLGGREGVVDELADALRRRYPGLVVAGTATPPFGEWSDETSRDLVRQVKESGARLLWLGVSAPKQEIWARRWLDELDMPVLCVGAAFDFSAGRVRRAPVWMRRSGFEWVHRLATEPRRMWRRYLLGNPLFVADVIRWWRRPATDMCGE